MPNKYNNLSSIETLPVIASGPNIYQELWQDGDGNPEQVDQFKFSPDDSSIAKFTFSHELMTLERCQEPSIILKDGHVTSLLEYAQNKLLVATSN